MYETFFFFNDPEPTQISPLPLPAPLPICGPRPPLLRARALVPRHLVADRRGGDHPARADLREGVLGGGRGEGRRPRAPRPRPDRKSTRLNSSHANISYAVFCLKKK